MRLLRGSRNPNTLVGIFLLVLLAIFAGPGMIPNLLPSLIPGADESILCQWLRTGDDRAEHQSLIGRAAENPLNIRVRTTALPQQTGQTLKVTIVISNESIGTIAIYYNPDQVRIGDDGASSGLGMVFNSPNPQPRGAGGGGAIPEEDIRLLGPRQSCVHHEEWSYEQIPQLGLSLGQNIVKAYYRSTSAGSTSLTNTAQQIIFGDQGLWVGVIESESIPIPIGTS
ncbi:MAG: hypothetical protein JNM70_18670 [Anaerolineae bacterium]|nr:hypothetical protein [Anaerolineae bacterium]